FAQPAPRLALSPIDEVILLAAIALELDPAFAILVAALAGAEPRNGLSIKLLGQVLHVSGADGHALRLGAGHPLIDAAVIEYAPGSDATPLTLRPFRVAPRVV